MNRLLSRASAHVSVLTILVTVASSSAAADTVISDTSRVHRCLPVTSDGATTVYASTDGGLIAVAADGRLRKTWTALDGLAGTRSHALLREGDTLWIGGEDGLTRAQIRGSELAVTASYESASSAPVRALLRHDGVLYAGTWGGGLQRLRNGALREIPTAAGQPAASRRITALAVHGGAVIAATAGQGLYRLIRGRLQPLAIPGLQRAMVWSLLAHDDRLLIGAVTGLYASTDLASRPDQFTTGDIRQLVRDDDRVVAAAFGQGVLDVRGEDTVALTGIPRGASFAYGYGAGGGVVCLAGHAGLWLRADGRPWRQAQRGGLPSGDISALAVQEDEHGSDQRVWIGTFDHGVAVYDDGRVRQFEHPRIDRKVNALTVADGEIWVGTSAGLSIIKPGVSPSGGDELASARVTRIGKRDGLPSSFVMALHPLREGGVLVGTARGAAIVRSGRIEVIGRKRGIYISNVWAVDQDADGSLLLGTTKGLYQIRPDGDWQRFSVASGHLRDDWVMALERVGDTWWVGTYKGGVSKLAPVAADDGEHSAGQTRNDAQTRSATHLGGGFVNPGGLLWHRGALHAATMDGMLTGDGTTWRPIERASTGRDTTALAVVTNGSDSGLWIASRRGVRIRSFGQ